MAVGGVLHLRNTSVVTVSETRPFETGYERMPPIALGGTEEGAKRGESGGGGVSVDCTGGE